MINKNELGGARYFWFAIIVINWDLSLCSSTFFVTKAFSAVVVGITSSMCRSFKNVFITQSQPLVSRTLSSPLPDPTPNLPVHLELSNLQKTRRPYNPIRREASKPVELRTLGTSGTRLRCNPAIPCKPSEPGSSTIQYCWNQEPGIARGRPGPPWSLYWAETPYHSAVRDQHNMCKTTLQKFRLWMFLLWSSGWLRFRRANNVYMYINVNVSQPAH